MAWPLFSGDDATNLKGREMEFKQAIQHGLKNYRTFKGRASRSEFWWFALFLYIAMTVSQVAISIVFALVLALYQPTNVEYIIVPMVLCIWALLIAFFIPVLATGTRRLHDKGRSGKWWFIILVPWVGAILLTVWMAMPGEETENKYGPPIQL